MWTRLVRISDPGQWFGKIHEPVTWVQHLVRTNSYVNASFLGPPLWRCGLYEEERTHSGS